MSVSLEHLLANQLQWAVIMNEDAMTTRTILAVLAHPDDESFGLGGTLAYYARKGYNVYLSMSQKIHFTSRPPPRQVPFRVSCH